MGAFEFRENSNHNNSGGEIRNINCGQSDCDPSPSRPPVVQPPLNPNRLREENLIAMKIYDSCRRQDCLTMRQIGPARSAESVLIGDHTINEGDVIRPPHDAASVSIDKLKIKKILIVDKEKNSFKKGFWDIELKFVFEYRVMFREADGCIIGSVKAHSIYNKKLTLFGSEGADLFIATDMFRGECENMLGTEPFVNVEAKAMALESALVCNRPESCEEGHGHPRKEVEVTIGLFFIVKLFRIVDLRVESRGFAIPKECEESAAIDPCDFFDQLSFPMDVFAPPQKPEFMAGISGDIPSTHQNRPQSNQCHTNGNNHHGNNGHGNNGPRDIREKGSCCN